MRALPIAAIVVAGLLSACAPMAPTPPAAERRVPENFPEEFYRQELARGTPVFRIDPVLSRVVIEVRRGGSLARLGHDHVVAGRDVQGLVAPDLSRADLYLELDRLLVDEPGLRAEAGFDTQPSEEDVAGTRRNMLNGLDAARHPFAIVSIDGREPVGGETWVNVAITLHGTTRTLQVPVRIEARAGEVAVSGRLALRQTDFGMQPLSVLGGAIAVQDAVDLRFQIVGHRIE